MTEFYVNQNSGHSCSEVWSGYNNGNLSEDEEGMAAHRKREVKGINHTKDVWKSYGNYIILWLLYKYYI